MNYKNHYSVLIERARNRILDVYTESHHIIPVCMGGTDDKENLVSLTPEEHYVAHQLLVKIYPYNHGLVNAAVMMSVNADGNRTNNKLYGWLRRRLSNVNSARQTGRGNSQFGTCWVYNIDNKVSKSIKKEELDSYLKSGWHKGRVLDFSKIKNCPICNTVFTGWTQTCSKECGTKLQIKHRSTILVGKETEFLELYEQYKNIDKVLKILGYPGNIAAYGNRAREIIKNAEVA